MVVKEVGEWGNMERRGGKVGGKENMEMGRGKLMKNRERFFVGEMGCEERERMRMWGEVGGDVLRRVFGIGENNGCVWGVLLDEGLEERDFLLVRRVEKVLFNRVGGFVLGLELNILGIVDVVEGELR